MSERMPQKEEIVIKVLARWVATAGVTAVLLASGSQAACAEPMPGYDLDPAKLAQQMDECLSYQMGENTILLGWMSFRDGRQRQWRCGSLRHMMRHDDPERQPHDPFSNVEDFMKCMDKVVSYGFPEPGNRPENTVMIYQYNGTSSRAIVAMNSASGDIATFYTEPRADDWSGCVHGL